jgi:hypothetical protein
MYRFSENVASGLLVAGLYVLVAWAPMLQAQAAAQTQTPQGQARQAQVRQVKVLGSQDRVEIEVDASDRIIPESQVLTGPDRLVVDFPNAVPGNGLRSQSVNRGEVKDLRVGLFQSRPPVTRVVVDLRTAQSYQIFPNGRTVIIKVLGSPAMDASRGLDDFPAPATRPGLVQANFTTGAERVHANVPARVPLEVSFRDGLLGIKSNKATLSEVLFAVQQRTGADIAIPAGAEQERVVADLGPGPTQEVLAHLLNGSRFNFLILNSANNPQQLDRVILTPRGEGMAMPQGPAQSGDDADDANAQGPAPPLEERTEPSVSPPPVPDYPRPEPITPPHAADDAPEQ